MEFLFRKQCAESSFSPMLGHTATHNNPMSKVIAFSTFTLVTTTFLILIFFGSYTRKITAKGVLSTQQHTAHTTSPANGIVEEMLVSEGDSVTDGQHLFRISKEIFSATGSNFVITEKTIKEQIRHAKNRRTATLFKNSQEALEIGQKRKELSTLIKITKSEIVLLRELVSSKRDNLRKFDILTEDGAASLSARGDAKNDYLNSSIELSKTNQRLQQLTIELEGLPAKRKSLMSNHEISISQIDNELLLLERELLNNESSKAIYVTSPLSGTISAINTSVGQSVALGAVLASVYPAKNDLQAHLYVPPEGIGFVETAQIASLRISAYPFQKFGMIKGSVSSVSQTPYNTINIPIQATEVVDTNKAYYKVTVTIDKQQIIADGTARMLKSGLVVEADLLMERRKLYEWLLAPIYSFTKK